VNFVESIARKRDGLPLEPEEIKAFVQGATSGTLKDEQLAAMLMAICIRGMSPAERQVLVEGMRDSGARWRIGEAFPEAVDKHSTGGVGDSVSLVFAPLVRACGVPVVMMAGAGLGHTQGTLDKLAAIPEFRTAGSREVALARLERCGVCFSAQSAEIAPADKKLYMLRDITGTVPSLPLITASIMSKKLAVGAARLVLDIKQGSGAFCKTAQAAQELGEALYTVAERAGASVKAMITDMEEPLGDRLGTANEVLASIEILRGGGDARLREVTIELGVDALVTAGRTPEAARAELESRLADGSALSQWELIVRAHGGDPDDARLARPRRTVTIVAATGGCLSAVSSEELGWVAVNLGAGRRFQGDGIDFAAGLRIHARIGNRIEPGQPIATLELGAREVDLDELKRRTQAAFSVGEAAPPVRPLVNRWLAARR
jgi:pyrimidine-nucleoside phosphorylase